VWSEGICPGRCGLPVPDEGAGWWVLMGAWKVLLIAVRLGSRQRERKGKTCSNDIGVCATRKHKKHTPVVYLFGLHCTPLTRPVPLPRQMLHLHQVRSRSQPGDPPSPSKQCNALLQSIALLLPVPYHAASIGYMAPVKVPILSGIIAPS